TGHGVPVAGESAKVLECGVRGAREEACQGPPELRLIEPGLPGGRVDRAQCSQLIGQLRGPRGRLPQLRVQALTHPGYGLGVTDQHRSWLRQRAVGHIWQVGGELLLHLRPPNQGSWASTHCNGWGTRRPGSYIVSVSPVTCNS